MHKRGESVPENMTLYFIKHVQLGSVVRVEPRILHMSRRFVKVILIFTAKGNLLQKQWSCISYLNDKVNEKKLMHEICISFHSVPLLHQRNVYNV